MAPICRWRFIDVHAISTQGLQNRNIVHWKFFKCFTCFRKRITDIKQILQKWEDGTCGIHSKVYISICNGVFPGPDSYLNENNYTTIRWSNTWDRKLSPCPFQLPVTVEEAVHLWWFENGPHSLIYLNTWSPSCLGRIRRYVLLSGCHCGMGIDVSTDLQYSLLCLLLMDQEVSLPLFCWLWRFVSEIKKQLRQSLSLMFKFIFVLRKSQQAKY